MSALLRMALSWFGILVSLAGMARAAEELPFARWQRTAEGARPWPELGLEVPVIAQEGAVYIVLEQPPAEGRLTLPRLNNLVYRAWWDVRDRAPTAVPRPSLTGSEYARPFVPPRERLLKFTQTPTAWTIALDGSIRYPAIVVLDVAGEPLLSQDPVILRPGSDNVLTLPAHHAAVHGEKLQFEPLPHKNTVGYWVNPQEWAEWRVATEQAATWDVHVLQGCGAGQGGSAVSLHVGEQQLPFQVEETGHFQNFRWRVVGQLTLPAGTHAIELRCHKLARNAVMDVRQIRLVPADAVQTVRDCRDVAPDCFLPPLTLEEPAPGRRLLLQAPGYAETSAYHVLTLPTDWNSQRRFPVIVEWTGNGPYQNERGDRCTGRVEDAKLGYGLAGNDGFLCLSLPYLNQAGTANVTQWWGSPPDHRPESTIAYARQAIAQTCQQFGGDPEALILVGFSRGALACHALGLHDDEIAPLWKALVCFSHYDGVRTWPYAGSDAESARRRLARLGPRPEFICSESQATGASSLAQIREYLAQSGVPQASPSQFTLAETGFVNHDDAWILRPSATRDALRSWLRAQLKHEVP